MKIILPMLVMLIAGLALGAGGSTLLWSGQTDRGFRAQAEWKIIADKWEALAKTNQTGWRECLTIASRR